MTSRGEESTLSSYPRNWRDQHGEVLLGMLADSREQRPNQVRKELMMARLHGSYARIRWALALALAIAAALLIITCGVIVGTSYTGQNVTFVQLVIFGLAPALSFLSVVAAIAASQRTLRVPWTTVAAGLIGIGLTCATHIAWYAGVDAPISVGAEAWLPLLIAAIAMSAVAVAALMFPFFQGGTLPRSAIAAICVPLSLIAGGAAVALLAVPLAGFALPFVALTTVIILHRRDRRFSPTQRAVPAL